MGLAGTLGVPSVSSRQLQVFHRRAVIESPPADASADSLGGVEADDGFGYYFKGDAHARSVRASWWISTHIAEAAGVHIAGRLEEVDDWSAIASGRDILS